MGLVARNGYKYSHYPDIRGYATLEVYSGDTVIPNPETLLPTPSTSNRIRIGESYSYWETVFVLGNRINVGKSYSYWRP